MNAIGIIYDRGGVGLAHTAYGHTQARLVNDAAR